MSTNKTNNMVHKNTAIYSYLFNSNDKNTFYSHTDITLATLLASSSITNSEEDSYIENSKNYKR